MILYIFCNTQNLQQFSHLEILQANHLVIYFRKTPHLKFNLDNDLKFLNSSSQRSFLYPYKLLIKKIVKRNRIVIIF